jgi:hypothetical protein
MITGRDLINTVLLDPAIKSDYDELRIISGYATSAMVATHIKMLFDADKNIKISLIIGMTPKEGMVDVQHEGFKKLMDEYPGKFECSYVMIKRTPCHSKLYIWLKEGVPVEAFIGSANYTNNAFFGYQQEILDECDPVKANDYYESFSGATIYCNHPEVEDAITIMEREQYRKKSGITEEAVGELYIDCQGLEHVTFSLLTEKGDPGNAGGRLNWGQRDRRNRNEAYLHVPAHIAKSGFFPPKKQQFTVLTDDGKSLICVIAQQGDKGIETPNNNSDLGLYFRERLGLESGAFVTREDLDRYGRTDVTFCKMDNETYYMDYSPKK